MTRKIFLFLVILFITVDFCRSQAFIRTSDLMGWSDDKSGSGSLTIIQDPAIDSLLSRTISANRRVRTVDGSQGIQGFRIQIYYSSVRTARDESSRARAEFINKFPDIVSYTQYQEPGYFIVRAGDYRTRKEGYKDLMSVLKVFPDAYLVPAVINYPGLTQK